MPNDDELIPTFPDPAEEDEDDEESDADVVEGIVDVDVPDEGDDEDPVEEDEEG